MLTFGVDSDRGIQIFKPPKLPCMKTIQLLLVFTICFCLKESGYAQPVNCQAAFTYTLGSAEGTGINVNFTSTSNVGAAQISSYEWNFGDTASVGSNPNTSSAQNPVHLYNHGGLYIVCLTIHASNGCFNSVCDTIFVPVTDPGPCYGLSAVWTGLIGPDGIVAFKGTPDSHSSSANYYWNFGDGSAGAGLNTSHSYASSGTYNVCLIASIPGTACTFTSCAPVVVNKSTCTANFVSYSGPAEGSGIKFQFNSTSSASDSIISYAWNFGDASSYGSNANTSTLQNPSHVFNGGQTYSVCLTITTRSQCINTICQTITIPVIDPGPCYGLSAIWTDSAETREKVLFRATADTRATAVYKWSFGDGSIKEGQDVTHVYAAAGNYNVCLIARMKDSKTCADTSCATVTTGARPVTSPADASYLTSSQVSPAEPAEYKFSLNIYPNPAGSQATVAYALDKTSAVNIDVLDMVGQVVSTVFSGNQDAGPQTLSWNSSGAASGIYFVRVNVDGKLYTQRVSVMH